MKELTEDLLHQAVDQARVKFRYPDMTEPRPADIRHQADVFVGYIYRELVALLKD
jgi:hypothetical protein